MTDATSAGSPATASQEAARAASRRSWQLSKNLSYSAGYLAVAVAVAALPLIAASPVAGYPVVTASVILAIVGLSWGGYSQLRYSSIENVFVGEAGLREMARHSAWRLFEEAPADQEGWRCGPLAATPPSALGPVAWSTPHRWIGVVPAGHVASGTWSDGAALAWDPLEVEVPHLAFIPPGIDPEVLAVEGAEVDVASWELLDRWRVFSSDPDAAVAVMTPELITVLNTVRPFPMAFFVEGLRALALADARVAKGGFSDLSSAAFDLAMALGPRKLAGKLVPERSAAELKKAYARASVGKLVSSSRVYSRVGFVVVVSMVASAAALLALAIVANFGPDDGTRASRMAPVTVYLTVLGVSWLAFIIALRAMSRVRRTQNELALQVVEVARIKGWTILARAADLEAGWTRKPFARVQRMRWAPAALGKVAGGTAGVASVEGDIGIGAWAPRLFTSRVAWADAGVELPRMDFLREGFSTRVAKLCGGSDLDLESYDFNTLWRIRTDDARAAHGLLQPTMIALLTEIADEGVAYHLDGTRVVMWDDGRNSSVDLARRVELVERFVAALPGFLKTPQT